MIDLRYILGRMDALSDVAVRIKSGGAEAAIAYCEEQIAMCRQAESELLADMEREMSLDEQRDEALNGRR